MNIDTSNIDKQALADRLVNNFINNYYETFGVKPKVSYRVDTDIPTLNEIFDLVNNEFKRVYPGRSIDEKNRDGIFIKYRNIYYQVAREFGYSLHAICLLTNQDHATVLHSLSRSQGKSPLKEKILEQFKVK